MNKQMKFSIAIAPTWSTVKEVLARATQFMEDKGQSPDFISATAMCATELIENAVKYGVETPRGGPISLDILIDDERIAILVKNGVKEKTDLEAVIEILDAIKGSDDPQALYVERLRQLINDPRPGVSRLGFLRIVYEGQFSLTHSYDEGVLTIRAERAVA